MTSNYLNSGMTQAECTKHVIEKLEDLIEHFLYNMRRYDVPVTLALIYSKENISEQLGKHKRLTDIERYVELPCGFFSFIFLPFTDSLGTHSFIKSLEKDFLNKQEHYVTFEELQHENHNTYNFINAFLFNIGEQVACQGNPSCNLPSA
jgi:hypothetical protein